MARTLPSGMQTHLDTGTTTLCWCWRITKTDSTKLGFTDHDNDLTFDSTTFEADSGISASEVSTTVGLNVDNLDVEGALQSAQLTEADIAAGLYDNALVELYRVNWQDVTQRVLMRQGTLGEISRKENVFVAEIRGLAHEFQQDRGRTYQYQCDATFGDSRCGVNSELSTYKGTGTVSTIDEQYRFYATGLTSYASGWFTGGILTWTSGNNNGRSMEVKYHEKDADDNVTVELWELMSETVAVTDTFTIKAGCNKTFAHCKDKFSNTVNYRGFPHMPGNSYTVAYPRSGDPDNDGGSMNN